MRYKLNTQHYADDRLLEPGAEVGDGDGTVHPWRYPANIETDAQSIKAGQAMPPSKEMTPLDDEAKTMWNKAFPSAKPLKTAGVKPAAIQGTLNVGVNTPKSPTPSQKVEPKKG